MCVCVCVCVCARARARGSICARARTHTHTHTHRLLSHTQKHIHTCIHAVQEVASAESGGVDVALAGSRGRYNSLCIHTAPCLCIRTAHAHQVQGGVFEAGFSTRRWRDRECVSVSVCALARACVILCPASHLSLSHTHTLCLSISSLPWPPLPARPLPG